MAIESRSKMACPIVIHSRNAFEDTVAMIDGSGVWIGSEW